MPNGLDRSTSEKTAGLSTFEESLGKEGIKERRISILLLPGILVMLGLVLSCDAQSFPAGQVTYRANRHLELLGNRSMEASERGGRCKHGPGGQEYDKNQYSYPTWFPTLGSDCTAPMILNYFAVEKSAVAADGVQYLYNAKQSTSQISADLITTTFSMGFQAILAGSATAGSGQPAGSPKPDGTQTQTDSVSTAVSKLETGGDFNLRFPFPVLGHLGRGYALDGRLVPNLGFDVKAFQGQSTITESSEYSLNLPFEMYAQTTSIDTDSPAIGFVDFRPSGELISTPLQKKLGIDSRVFFLGEAAIGVEFAQKVRISFQYFVGPKQVYQDTTASGTATTATHIGGFHLAVSFAPQKPPLQN